MDETAKRLNEAIADIRRLLLNQETLTNLAAAATNLRAASDRASKAIDSINLMVKTNTPWKAPN